MPTIQAGTTVFQDISLIIFDKDGTLMDVHTYWANMVRLRATSVCERLGAEASHIHGIMDAMGVDTSNRIKPEGPVGIKKREIVLQAGVDYCRQHELGDQSDLFHQVFADVDEQSKPLLEQFIRPLPDAQRLFGDLRNAGCRIAIATADRGSRADMAMKHLGLAGYIDFTLGADHVKNAKPSPEMVFAILAHLQMDSEHTLLVGDAETDIEMGNRAGLRGSIGVATGLTSAEKLRTITPYVIQDLSAIRVIEQD